MNALPNGYTSRPATLDDTDAIAELINQHAIRLTGEPYLPAEHLHRYLSMPGLDLEISSQLVFSPSSALAGFALVMDIQSPYVKISAWGFVPESERGQGIGAAFHSWIVPRAREAIAKAPEGTRVTVEQSVFGKDKSAQRFLSENGYQQTRHFWKMAVELEDSLATAIWPEGIIIQTVDLRKDLERPYRAVDATFRDHYGHVDGDFEERLERQRHNLENDPDYSPELSFLAMDGDQIAGVCMCSPRSGMDTSVGYVSSLGVLPPWRKRGLGLALLQHAFGVFKQKGKIGAALHVDAQSLTGATRLYEKAGMHVDQLSHEYQLELRTGVDLSTTG
jgi:mycothiol synthase